MIRSAFARFANIYSFFVACIVVLVALSIVTTVWMATTHSVAPELLQQLGPISPASQDPRVEPHIPLNTSVTSAFRKVEVHGWEYEFESKVHEERLTHTLGILSLHNGGTYSVDPLTAPVEFVSALEAASENGVAGFEQFLVDAGNGAGWRESDYEEYETVVLDLEASFIEEFLFKAFYFALVATMLTLPVTVAMFRAKWRRSDTQVADLRPGRIPSQ